MKKHVLACALTLSVSANVQAEGWFDTLKDLVGLGESTQQAQPATAETAVKTGVEQVKEVASSLDVAGLLGSVTQGLNVSTEQAEGGLGSLLSFAKNNLGDTDYTELAKSIPGVDGLLSKVPDVSSLSSSSSEGMGGLLNKAAEYSDSLKDINALTQQFEALGLKPEMITQYISAAQSYLDTDQGQQAKDLLMKGLESFTSK